MASAVFTAAASAASAQFHLNAQANRDLAFATLDLQREAQTTALTLQYEAQAAALEQMFANQAADQAAAREAAIALKKMQLGVEVDRAFLTLLNRQPTEDEHIAWTDIVYSTGAQSVRSWAAQQAGLDTYQLELRANSEANTQNVKLAFQIYLFREPTADEQSFWVEYANGTASLDALLQQLSTNSMASIRYGAGIGSQSDNVTQAFNVLFGRVPSAAEKLAWADSSGYALPWLLAQASLNAGASTTDAMVMGNRFSVANEIRTLAEGANTPIADGGSTSADQAGGIGSARLEVLITQAILSTGVSTQSVTNALQVASDIINPPEQVAVDADTTRPAEGTLTRGDGLVSMTFSEPIKWLALDSNGTGQIEFNELPIRLTGTGVTFGSQAQVLSATADRLVIGIGQDARLGNASILFKDVQDLAGNKADLLFAVPPDTGFVSSVDTTAPSSESVMRENGAVILNFTESILWTAMDTSRNGKVEFSELPIVITGDGNSFGSSPMVLSAQGPRLIISVGNDAVVEGPIFLAGVKDLAGNAADVIFI